MLCIVCHKRTAVLPDRNTMSIRKRVCRECHGARLDADLRRILKITTGHHRWSHNGPCEEGCYYETHG